MNVISKLDSKNLFNLEDMVYFLFAGAVVSIVLYIGVIFGTISDNSSKRENSDIFKKTFQKRYKEK